MIHYLHRGIVFLSLSFISPQLLLFFWLEDFSDYEVDSFLDLWWQIYLSLRDDSWALQIIAAMAFLIPVMLIDKRLFR